MLGNWNHFTWKKWETASNQFYIHLFLRSLFRRLQSSGKPMLRDCVPPVSTSLVSSQTIRRFSGSGISMCGDLFLIFLAGCLALKDFLLMSIVWCIKPNLQRLELENIFRPGCLGAIFFNLNIAIPPRLWKKKVSLALAPLIYMIPNQVPFQPRLAGWWTTGWWECRLGT